MAVSILYPLWKIQERPTQGPPRRPGILLQQNFLWVEQAGAGRARMPGGQKHKKETNKHTKIVQKGAALRAAPFGIIFLWVYLSLFCVFDPQASLLCQPLLAQPIKKVC